MAYVGLVHLHFNKMWFGLKITIIFQLLTDCLVYRKWWKMTVAITRAQLEAKNICSFYLIANVNS